MTNLFQGLHTGPIDHQSTSVINAISQREIDMGSPVILFSGTIESGELLPRVSSAGPIGTSKIYGIAVGGDTDGIYGKGSIATDDTTRATSGAGQAVKIVTQGRALARVRGVKTGGVNTQINIGDPLTHSTASSEQLQLASTGEVVIARALNIVFQGINDIIAVDVKREGPL